MVFVAIVIGVATIESIAFWVSNQGNPEWQRSWVSWKFITVAWNTTLTSTYIRNFQITSHWLALSLSLYAENIRHSSTTFQSKMGEKKGRKRGITEHLRLEIYYAYQYFVSINTWMLYVSDFSRSSYHNNFKFKVERFFSTMIYWKDSCSLVILQRLMTRTWVSEY